MTGRANGSIRWSTYATLVQPYLKLGAWRWGLLMGLVLFIPAPVMRLAKRRFGLTRHIE